MENWIFDNATEEICIGCTDNPYSNAYECLKHRENCPHKAHLQLVELLADNLLKIIADTAKVTHLEGEPYEIDPTIVNF